MFYIVNVEHYEMFDESVSPNHYQTTEYFTSLNDALAYVDVINNQRSSDDELVSAVLGDTVDRIPTTVGYRTAP